MLSISYEVFGKYLLLDTKPQKASPLRHCLYLRLNLYPQIQASFTIAYFKNLQFKGVECLIKLLQTQRISTNVIPFYYISTMFTKKWLFESYNYQLKSINFVECY